MFSLLKVMMLNKCADVPQAGARRKIIVFDGQQRLLEILVEISPCKQQMQGFFFSLLV